MELMGFVDEVDSSLNMVDKGATDGCGEL